MFPKVPQRGSIHVVAMLYLITKVKKCIMNVGIISIGIHIMFFLHPQFKTPNDDETEGMVCVICVYLVFLTQCMLLSKYSGLLHSLAGRYKCIVLYVNNVLLNNIIMKFNVFNTIPCLDEVV